MKIYRNSLFLCLILLFSFNASFAKEKWIRVDAPNFTLYGDSDEKNIKNVAFKLEQFRKTLGLLLPNAKLNSSLPTVVYVFKDDDSFKPFKPMENGKINERVAGYFFQSGDTNYIALSTDPRLREPFRLIFHEYFHFVMENNLDSAPIWVNEGLAEYYSTFEVANNNEGANIGKLINDSLVKLKSRDIIPLDKFFNLEKGTKDYSKAVKDGIFYPQAWAVVHFFLNANSGQRSEQFYQFVGKLNQGAEVKKSFQESFNADYKQIENELRQYLGKFQFNFIKYTFTGKLISESSFTSREISEAETLQKKGDLLVYSEQQDKSQKFLYDAIKQDPNLVSAHLSLGKLNLNLKRYQLARS
ncbi:MAG TPA: DUF1570 domain-containing protein, partial [Pyrinomonadaceae bacterium]|nr:DUF1570 domain-containing protein [Pyrinomonadaceae bacterium]